MNSPFQTRQPCIIAKVTNLPISALSLPLTAKGGALYSRSAHLLRPPQCLSPSTISPSPSAPAPPLSSSAPTTPPPDSALASIFFSYIFLFICRCDLYCFFDGVLSQSGICSHPPGQGVGSGRVVFPPPVRVRGHYPWGDLRRFRLLFLPHLG